MIPTTRYVLQGQLRQLQNGVCSQLDRHVVLHGMKEESGEEARVRVKGTKGETRMLTLVGSRLKTFAALNKACQSH